MYISQSGSGTSREGCVQEAGPRAGTHPGPRPPGVLLYLCVSDARDIAVYEIIKEVHACSRCRKSVSSAFITFFCAQKNIIKLLSNVLVLENT